MPINLQYALWGIVAVLVLGTLAILLKTQIAASADDRELWLRMQSWWIMAGLFVLAIALGQLATIALLCLVSVLALKEYFSIIQVRAADKPLLYLTYIAAVLQFFLVWWGNFSLFLMFIPVCLFLILPFCMIIKGETQGFLNAVASLQWGLMATVFLLSHAAYLLVLPMTNKAAGNAGLLLFLLFLTQFNDVLQYVWGRCLGKTNIVPHISPSKTLAGFVGGVSTTILLAWLLAPHLTPFKWQQALVAGALIGLGGFVGDVVISAIKRDIGLKNTSNLIPGHGGILDRIDSLIFTAPLFFYFVYFLHF